MSQHWIPDKGLVRRQLEDIRQSDAFARSARLFLLLEFLVDETIQGRGESLKELVIGDALYSSACPYDPGIDSTVRVEARRLRRKLKAYYEDNASRPSVRILMPDSGYRPQFLPCTGMQRVNISGDQAEALAGIDLAVMPFSIMADTGTEHGAFADGLTEELIYILERRTSLRLAPRLVVFQFKDRDYAIEDARIATRARMLLHGSLRFGAGDARLTVELVDVQGFTLWSTRISCDSGGLMAAPEELAHRIFQLLPGQIVERRSASALALVT